MSRLPDRLQQRKFQFLDKFKQSQSRRLYSSDDDSSSIGTARSNLSPDGVSARTINMEGQPKRRSLIEEIQFNDPVARDYDAEAREDAERASLQQVDLETVPEEQPTEQHDGSRRQTLIPIVIETMPDTEAEDDDDNMSGGLTHRMVKSETAADDARSRLSFLVQDRLHLLVSEVKRRTSDVRETLLQEAEEEELQSTQGHPEERRASLSSLIGINHEVEELDEKGEIRRPPTILKRTVDPNSRWNMAWLSLQTIAFLYNAITIPLRSSYPYQTKNNLVWWLMLDYFFDLIYLSDMIIWKPRRQFMKGGMPTTSIRETSKEYLDSREFKLDVISILPTDLFYIISGPLPMYRANRFLHYKAFGQLFDMLDNSFSNPYAIRVARTLSYMIYIIHLNSCVYYVLSALQAFGQIAYPWSNPKFYLNKWVYNNQGNSYVRCFYFTAAVATSTGNNPAPSNVIEYIYMTFSWMMGVFVFALLLGQIRDIVSNANRNQEEYRRKMDAALYECQRLRLPEELTQRVRSWFIYTWEQHKTLDEKRLIEKLPLKLQTDLALSVHYATLSKVKLFQDCERALLRDLVLKLRAVIFLPGDMVCQKGDVGKDMYIVNAGILQVVGGELNEKVFAELGQGSVFGEISLLAIGGNNRRTASIRAKGYATLFALSKEDLQDVIKYYPQAQAILKKKAAEMLNKDKKAEGPSAATTKNLEETCKLTVAPEPKMLKVIAQVLPENSETTVKLKKALEDRRPSMLLHPDGDLSDFSDMSDISDIEEDDEAQIQRENDQRD